LEGSSFSAGTSQTNYLQNSQFLNAKGINQASINTWYMNGSAINYLTIPNTSNTPFIHFKDWFQLQLTLPKLSLIKGVWWSTYYKASFKIKLVIF
jgi:hypothetical protein